MPDQEEELESSKQSAALGESKKLSHQLVNGNPLLCLNREYCKTPKSWLDLSIELWNVCRQAVAKFYYVTKLLPKLSSPQPPPAVVCFFEASVFFSIENAIFCPTLQCIVGNFGYFVTNVRTFWCSFTRQNSSWTEIDKYEVCNIFLWSEARKTQQQTLLSSPQT